MITHLLTKTLQEWRWQARKRTLSGRKGSSRISFVLLNERQGAQIAPLGDSKELICKRLRNSRASSTQAATDGGCLL